MTFEEMMENWEKFNFTAEEEGIIVDVDRQAAKATSKSLGFSLIGKLLAPRIIAGDVMRRNFKAAWNIPSELTVEKLGQNLFIFSLKWEEDQVRILRQGPWLFDKFVLVLSKPIPMVKPTMMEFKYVPFWIHFCDLPMDPYNLSMAERLGNAIGRFEEYDNGGGGLARKESLHVRVALDISKPLRRCIKVNLDESHGSCWASIRYEKLFDLCSFCGIIEHNVRDCSSFYMADEPPSQRNQYGMWMQFSGKAPNVFRSPSTSPLGKTDMAIDVVDHSTPNAATRLPVGHRAGEGNTDNGSPMNVFDSRSMDVSSAVAENVTLPQTANNLELNTEAGKINVDENSKVKKRLDYDSFSLEINKLQEKNKDDLKMKEKITQTMVGFNFQPNFEQMPSKPPMNSDIFGASRASYFSNDQPNGINSSGSPSMNQKLQTYPGNTIMQAIELHFGSHITIKPEGLFMQNPPNTGFMKEDRSGLKVWKRRARASISDPTGVSQMDNQKKRAGNGILGGSRKRVRIDEDNQNVQMEPSAEIAEQSRREP